MQNPTLTSLLAEIRAEEGIVAVELEATPKPSRAGWELRKMQAVSALVGLKLAYQQNVGRSAVGVYLTGPIDSQKEFAKIAKNLGAIVLDSKAFYTEISKDAANSMGVSGRFTPTEASHLLHSMRAVVHEELKLEEFERPAFVNLLSKYIKPEELAADVQEAVVKVNGHRLAAIYLGKAAAKEALATGYNKDVVAVVIVGGAQTEIEDLSKSGQFTGRPSGSIHLDGSEVTEDFVRDAISSATGVVFKVEEPVRINKHGKKKSTQSTTQE